MAGLASYQGSCHCGAVAFEAGIDLSKGTIRCNCRLCTKQRNWPFGKGSSPRWGAYVAVSVHCLDGLTDEELAALPVSYLDGRNDNWELAPVPPSAESR